MFKVHVHCQLELSLDYMKASCHGQDFLNKMLYTLYRLNRTDNNFVSVNPCHKLSGDELSKKQPNSGKIVMHLK